MSDPALSAEPNPNASANLPPPTAASVEVPKVVAVECIRKMRGSSQPFLMRCDNGSLYVVKFRNNPQHVKVLANELLAACLGRLMGLPVAAPAVVDVPAALIERNPQLEFELGVRREPCLPGAQFGSRYPEADGHVLVVDFLPDRLLRRVNHVEAVFLGAYVFDKWTCNCDGRQVIFFRPASQEPSAYSAALIDHGFCFDNGEWKFPDSPIRSFYPRRLVYESVRGLRSFEPYLSRIENLESRTMEALISAIPSEWCGDDFNQLERLGDRLFERRRRVRQLIIEARDSSWRPFPNWN